ncbi:hypothetical protein COLO4_38497 [Corchorus olitorius]|uniref:Uncharacterized protein n=1 Tax=Corchorus olitorius TaxID=93759 RepID=A0A1R3FUN4_9ROSI|nr:hypothetical protein COLO4_38497 [Corchorus olitorius]
MVVVMGVSSGSCVSMEEREGRKMRERRMEIVLFFFVGEMGERERCEGESGESWSRVSCVCEGEDSGACVHLLHSVEIRPKGKNPCARVGGEVGR